MIIGLSGFTGVGKDSLALELRNVGLHRGVDVSIVGLADPIKRILCDVYAFDPEHVWGPSSLRNTPDRRYPNPAIPGGFLTPRYALQQLGTEWGRQCYPETWLEYGKRTALRLLADPLCVYEDRKGLREVASPITAKRIVCIKDCRFRNEFASFRQMGGKLVRITSDAITKPVFDHPSETEQMQLADSYFDHVIHNPYVDDEADALAQLRALASDLLESCFTLGLWTLPSTRNSTKP